MNKLTQGEFDHATTTIEKPKTQAQKLAEFRKANEAAYRSACHDSECTCTPTRAQMLLMDTYLGRIPID